MGQGCRRPHCSTLVFPSWVLGQTLYSVIFLQVLVLLSLWVALWVEMSSGGHIAEDHAQASQGDREGPMALGSRGDVGGLGGRPGVN